MIYPQNFEQKIGFTEIRTMLKGRCLSSLGTEWVERQLRFMSRVDDVRQALTIYSEYVRYVDEADEEPECDFFDVREALLRARPEGTYMEEQDLFLLKRSLHTIHAYTQAFMQSCGDDDAPAWDTPNDDDDEQIEGADDDATAVATPAADYRYPALAAMAEQVDVFPEVVRLIESILDKYGKVKDSASPELQQTRRQLEQTMRSISHSLRNILAEAQQEGFIARDVAPTMRDGRLVIPVAPSLKKKFQGIVHDESASGRTVFIEPAAVVEANNRIRELKAAEKREVIRILQELTASIRPHMQAMSHSLKFLAHVDFLRALHQFALSQRAIVPEVAASPRIAWEQARHPLLEQSLARHGKHMIPLQVRMPANKRILLISGPNAGGKSVCLKTVALLQYMLQCGMPVPAGEGSKPGIFHSMFIDIGDEQSLENELSTYSSHLLGMSQMLKKARRGSLVLIDEFGRGTEPQMGGALAEGMLHTFVRNGTHGIITTHYQNLKNYAQQHDATESGAMLYDREQMQPLYQLRIGHPGSSFAIEIARKSGLPDEVIQYATRLVGKDYVMSDRYLQDIMRDKMLVEKEKHSLQQSRQQLDHDLQHYAAELAGLREERKRILTEAKSQAEELVAAANAKIENTIRLIKEAQAEKEKTLEARRELADFTQTVPDVDTEEENIARRMAKIQRRQERRRQSAERRNNGSAPATATPAATQQAAPPSSTQPVLVGSFVRLKGQTTTGRVQAIQGKQAKVLFGMMHTHVPLSRLEVTDAPSTTPSGPAALHLVNPASTAEMREKQLRFSPQTDLRGMRADEALRALAYYIDDAIQFGQGTVKILHGTGTGALRQLVRDYLASTPGIRSYHDEHVQFGGAGITVVELE